MQNSLFPVAIFCYKKLHTLEKTIMHLLKNKLSGNTDLFIYSDGAKDASAKEDVEGVRSFLRTIKGFQSITIIESPVNKGLANSIIDGVSAMLEKHEAVIVLEDDLLSSENFLQFMNAALHFYKENSQVLSISGYSLPLDLEKEYGYDNYFTRRASSWGWATWRNRWRAVDWQVTDYAQFARNRRARHEFNRMGSDLSSMIRKQMEGKINSWAIRWCYHQYKYQLYSVFPVVSLIRNIGFDDFATHTPKAQFSRFSTVLDVSGKSKFRFNSELALEDKIIRRFVSQYSVFTRVKYRLLEYL
jgi:hypothetical protein